MDCVLSAWRASGECSVSCGGGTQTWIRTVETPAQHGGSQCDISRAEVRPCNTQPCPVDCVLSAWSPSANCSQPCGGGTQPWNRTVLTPAQHGGRECDDHRGEVRACNPCPCNR